eukprot:CAMPEP_0197638716 /NCGR_PEP_ID=MMETSP1338-20131121/13569_1 /TAXON_ID=43686 ORGANISM="Pelagodinium beii, Strain RCC1491" /NCGR_SAMPLE_ID=MMETSP1338 /ASSEMBLY_ACC=CAM_ASM_000754 /LENGTH=146 /DNA_ID=CAMNT_0043211343 /DNA_START=1 /DNA_END=437 /DNA_ORIENTATION=+
MQPCGHMGTLCSQAGLHRSSLMMPPPPPPKPNVMITVNKVGEYWCLTQMSGLEIAKVSWGTSLKELQAAAEEALKGSECNVVLLDESGNPFSLPPLPENASLELQGSRSPSSTREMPEKMEISQAAKSGDGTVNNVGIKVNGKFKS